jgi:hypothetical protein
MVNTLMMTIQSVFMVCPFLDRMAVTADQYGLREARSRATARWALLEFFDDSHSATKRIDADQRLAHVQTSRHDRRNEKGQRR